MIGLIWRIQMDKIKLAHDWAMKYGSPESFILTVDKAWKYADAMQAEADKRNIEAKNTDISEFQIDWSQAPEWAEWWAVGKDAIAVWFDGKPTTSNGYLAFGYALQCDVAPQFNYKGNWKDSLHKRPDSK